MIRILPLPSVKLTSNSRCCVEWPTMISRCSRAEWSGSSKIRANGSTNTVSASSKPTRCFLALASAFTASHSKSTRIATDHEGITMQSAVQRFQHGSNDRSAVPPNELTRECSQPTEPDRRQPSYPRSARYRFIVASAAARSCSSSRSFRTASATSMRSSSSEVST